MTELTSEENQADGSTGESFGEVTERESTEPAVEAKAETEAAVEPAETEETPAPAVEPALTDKGTKVDPDPLSAANQLRANAEREARALKTLLSDPERLSQYMKEQFPPKVEAAPVKQYTAEDFANLEDVANVVNKLQAESTAKTEAQEATIKQLTTAVKSLLQGGRAQQLASTTESDVNTLKGMPELDPKSPDFIDGLENDIAEMYHKLDFDEQTGTYKGQYSIADIGNRMITAAKRARQAGSLKAQTVVKDKSQGKVVTSPKAVDDKDTSNMSPENSIAQGISKMKF